MMTCALFAKSPNCASQSTSVSGESRLYPVLEPKHRRFRQGRVVHLEPRPFRRYLSERAVPRVVCDVGEHGVTLTKRPADGVLAAQTHGHTVLEQCRKCQRFGSAEVRRPLSSDHFRPLLQQTRDLRVRMKVRRNAREPVAQRLQPILGYCRLHVVLEAIATATIIIPVPRPAEKAPGGRTGPRRFPVSHVGVLVRPAPTARCRRQSGPHTGAITRDGL